MSLKMRPFIAILSLTLCSWTAYAQNSYHELKSETETLVERLGQNDGLMTADGVIRNTREVYGRFEAVHDLTMRVVKSTATNNQKAELILDLATAHGKYFEAITKPYEDVQSFDFKWDPGNNFFQNTFTGFWEFIKHGTIGTLRDVVQRFNVVKMFRDRTLPFNGANARRTRVVNKVGADLQARLKEQIKIANTEEGKQGVAAILAILNKSQSSEVFRSATSFKPQMWFYGALASWLVIWAPFDWLVTFDFERTTFSPLVARFEYVLLMSALVKTRFTSTGISYVSAKKAMEAEIKKVQAQFNFDCNEVMNGRPLPPT